MKEHELKDSKDETPILTVIQKIKDKKLDPKLLAKEERLLCVEALMSEGYTEAQIAQVLLRCQKTIKRDLEEIREKNSFNPDINMAKRIIGSMIMKAEIHEAYLMRLARKTEGSIGEKAQAEYLAWTVLKDCMRLLQTLGYLPLRPQEVMGNFYHHQEESLSPAELKIQIEQTETAALKSGCMTETVKRQLDNFKGEVAKLEIAGALDQIKEEIKGKDQNAE